MTAFNVITGDCCEVMRGRVNSVDAIVCDPPYGLNFMGKAWDSFGREIPAGVAQGPTGIDFKAGATGKAHSHGLAGHDGAEFGRWCEAWAREALSVLKPGGHLVAFGGTRTYHRLTCALEDAGFEIRDSLMWLYGTGFPKSLNVGKALDAKAGAAREVVGFDASRVRVNRKYKVGAIGNVGGGSDKVSDRTDNGATITAPTTALAKQWDGWGTALKPAFEPIVLARKPLEGTVAANVAKWGTGALNIDASRLGRDDIDPSREGEKSRKNGVTSLRPVAGPRGGSLNGRWPANVMLDEEEAGALLDEQSSGASRFFYCAKASRSERGEGNVHPTVKPLALMRWLVRLVTPPGGLVLDPFAGSGTTGVAALTEGFSFVGVEQDAAYADIARARIGKVASP